MIQVKTTSKNQPWSLNLRNRVGDSVTHAGKTWINKTGANSEPGVGTDWEIIDVGGEGIPITGTLSDKPITGNLEIDSNAYIELFQPANPDFGEEYAIKKGIYFGADEFLQMYAYKGSGLEGEEPFRQGVLKMLGHELALEQYFYNGVVQKTVGFLLQEDFISVLGPLKGTEDHSDIYPTNKKVYAQRAYVDKANSYSTDEIKTGGVWIDGKPIYRKVLTKVVNTQTDSIPFDFENKEIIRQEVLFQDYIGLGVGHNNQLQLNSKIDLRAYLYPDDGALLIRNIDTGNNIPTGLVYQEVKVIAIIEYTKTTD